MPGRLPAGGRNGLVPPGNADAAPAAPEPQRVSMAGGAVNAFRWLGHALADHRLRHGAHLADAEDPRTAREDARA
ncbi:hypothetical protein ACFW6K_32115, partial [Streptomyces sp. NPDC058733]